MIDLAEKTNDTMIAQAMFARNINKQLKQI